MKTKILLIIYTIILSACGLEKEKDYLFFLHGRFLEEHALEEKHPSYGTYEYLEILRAFEQEDFIVFSEKRARNTNARDYALKVKNQIDRLLERGVAANKITIIGTSKGGYIAQYISTFAKNPDLNFIFIASYREDDITLIPEINFCGNILTIFEKTDEYGVSAISRKENSNCTINHFKEIELNTRLKHGFLFKPLKEWIEPSIDWAKRNYEGATN